MGALGRMAVTNDASKSTALIGTRLILEIGTLFLRSRSKKGHQFSQRSAAHPWRFGRRRGLDSCPGSFCFESVRVIDYCRVLAAGFLLFSRGFCIAAIWDSSLNRNPLPVSVVRKHDLLALVH